VVVLSMRQAIGPDRLMGRVITTGAVEAARAHADQPTRQPS
jgi:hypothetical protein